MLEDSARTGFLDLILAVIGLASLAFNQEVALVLLSCALFEFLANRIFLLQRIFSAEHTPEHVAKPRHKSL
ncbi:hypothetical protein HYV43_02270 [Candidatus Micrarchaeota archaeon]|nr:hypothetical protein [Candidatus Micrarchaeota archaeon]